MKLPKLPEGVHRFKIENGSKLLVQYVAPRDVVKSSPQNSCDFKKFVALTNGSYVNGAKPVGTLILNGQLKYPGWAITGQRGFLAVVNNRIVIGRMNLARVCKTLVDAKKSASDEERARVAKINAPAYYDYSATQIRDAMRQLFGTAFPQTLMGGAWLLRDDSLNANWNKDWYETQCFRQSMGDVVPYTPGFVAGQFGASPGSHILIGQTSAGQNTQLIIAVASTRDTILRACADLKLLLKLDGGAQFFAHANINGEQYSTPGKHPIALGLLR